MKTVFYAANQRGVANHGWLKSHHSFSFAQYYDPNKMGFGVLRVLNDDVVAPKMGFSAHPHNNMEIISIPLKGALDHEDSMGNKHTISSGEIQIMSAGTGIIHSERNNSMDVETEFLQIWVEPKSQNVEPRYDQQAIPSKLNSWVQILSPNPEDDGVWVHQDAWFTMGEFTQEQTGVYSLNLPQNATYIFVLEGTIEIGKNQENKE